MSAETQEAICITLLSLKAQNEGAEIAVKLRLEAGDHCEQNTFVISTEQYCSIKPSRGPIGQELYLAIEAAANIHSAVKRGEGLLSCSSNSARGLAQKLCKRGYDRKTAEAAAEQLVEKGFINERQDVEREVERCVRKLWGTARIRAHLWQKGFDSEAMDALQDLFAEIDFVTNCTELIEKRYREIPQDPAEYRRMVASLLRYGYTAREVREAIALVRSVEE